VSVQYIWQPQSSRTFRHDHLVSNEKNISAVIQTAFCSGPALRSDIFQNMIYTANWNPQFHFYFSDTNILLRFMFCWPCISIHLCNKNQFIALFMVSLFRQSTSTCFGHICSPSAVYIQQLVRVVPFSLLSVGRVEMELHLNPANRLSNENHNTY